MNPPNWESAVRVRRALRNVRNVILVLLCLPLIAHAMGSWVLWPPNSGTPSALNEVTGFGSNPGLLRMFKYVPPGLGPSRPLVVALHGCTQQAQGYDDETGWVKLADRYGFALLLPEEEANPLRCFRWFDPRQNQRGEGEALSIRQMIDKMETDHRIDPKHVYVTGLSAGGAMTAVMLSTYPDVFAGGAVIAGVPYKCAANDNEAQNACGLFGRPLAPEKQMTPAQWGALVRAASGYTGTFPRVSLWHGNKDNTVNPQDMTELMEQWTDVLGIDQTPEVEETVNGHMHKVYQDRSGAAQVETWLIDGMAHGTPVDPGNGEAQCGNAAPFILPARICSSLFILRFWGLDPL